jgi:hypothetical protein
LFTWLHFFRGKERQRETAKTSGLWEYCVPYLGIKFTVFKKEGSPKSVD